MASKYSEKQFVSGVLDTENVEEVSTSTDSTEEVPRTRLEKVLLMSALSVRPLPHHPRLGFLSKPDPTIGTTLPYMTPASKPPRRPRHHNNHHRPPSNNNPATLGSGLCLDRLRVRPRNGRNSPSMGQIERYLGPETPSPHVHRLVLSRQLIMRSRDDDALVDPRESIAGSRWWWDQYFGFDLYFGFVFFKVFEGEESMGV